MDHINPKHYGAHPSGVQCIRFTTKMDFNSGNAFKYVWRAGGKNGQPVRRDLGKALWYMVEFKAEYGAQTAVAKPMPQDLLQDFQHVIRCEASVARSQCLRLIWKAYRAPSYYTIDAAIVSIQTWMAQNV